MLVGAIDVATDRVETPEDVAATLRAALAFVPANRLQACTNCGMVPLSRGARSRQTGRAGGGGSAGPERAFLVDLGFWGDFRPLDSRLTPLGIVRIVPFVFCFKY